MSLSTHATGDISNDHARVGLTVNNGVLIAPIQVELHDDVLYALHNDALQMIQARDLHGLLLDLSQLKVMDYTMAQQLAQLLKMAALLGTRGIVTGLQAGVVATIVEWSDVWYHVETAVSLDAGLQMLHEA